MSSTATRQHATSTVGVLDPAKLVARRAELGLLQKEVAAKAKISPQMLADMECGRRRGSTKTRAKVARALQTSLRHLVYKG